MRLATHEWGSGARVALLLHGLMSDHRVWRRVGPALADLGYRVVGVDLRGHGMSPRADAYSPELFADDVVETVDFPVELAIGHSLGGLVLSFAAARLRPRRAVYCDPAWSLADPAKQVGPEGFRAYSKCSRSQMAFFNPRWEEEDLDIEATTHALWDPEAADFLGGRPLTAFLPDRPVVPSLVQLADGSVMTGPQEAALLADRGFEVRTVEGAGHCVMRDDFDGFMKSLDGWV